MRRLIPIFLAAGCVTPEAHVPTSAIETPAERSPTALLALTGTSPRRGVLVVHPDRLELKLRRGSRVVPFLSLERGAFDLGCWQPTEDYPETTIADWWLFTGQGRAVALQFSAYDVSAWFWDEERDCAVRVAALDSVTAEDAAPQEYYRGDDAQVAYRWNYATADATTPSHIEVQGDELANFLEAVPGDERLVVEPDIIAIRSQSGETLLHEQFEIDPRWPCYNSQLSVFRALDGAVYAIASFETFGELHDCASTRGDTRYFSVILDWDPRRRRFVQSFRVEDTLRPLDPTGEDSMLLVERHVPIAGGKLHVRSESATRYSQDKREVCTDLDTASGVCLAHYDCWGWSSSSERATRYELVGSDGVRIEVGAARAGSRERGDDCDAAEP